MRLHALQRRQAQQFVETFEQTKAGQFAAQAKRHGIGFGAVDFDRIGIGDFERHVEPGLQLRKIGERWQDGRHTNRLGFCNGLFHGWLRHHLDRGLRHGTESVDSDFAQPSVEPVFQNAVAHEPVSGDRVGLQILLLELGHGLDEPALLTEREGVEQTDALAWHVTLAVALDQAHRSFGLLAGQRGQDRQQQQFRIGGAGLQRLLGDVCCLCGAGGESVPQGAHPIGTGFAAEGWCLRVDAGDQVLIGRRLASDAHGVTSAATRVGGLAMAIIAQCDVNANRVCSAWKPSPALETAPVGAAPVCAAPVATVSWASRPRGRSRASHWRGNPRPMAAKPVSLVSGFGANPRSRLQLKSPRPTRSLF